MGIISRIGKVKIDCRALKDFTKKLEKLEEKERNLFLKSCAKELAARLLAKVIKRTPVKKYLKGTGKKGGTLRRGWTSGKNSNAKQYVNTLNVNQFGGTYVVEITNPVEYASYVEYGHRTQTHRGWVNGKFMLTISENELEPRINSILEKKLLKKLGECFK